MKINSWKFNSTISSTISLIKGLFLVAKTSLDKWPAWLLLLISIPTNVLTFTSHSEETHCCNWVYESLHMVLYSSHSLSLWMLYLKWATLLLTYKGWVIWSVFLRSLVLYLTHIDNLKLVNVFWRWHNEPIPEWTCFARPASEKYIPAGIGPWLLFLYIQL